MEIQSECLQDYITIVARIDNPHRRNSRHFLSFLSLEFPLINRICLYPQMPNETTSCHDDSSFHSLLVVNTGILNNCMNMVLCANAGKTTSEYVLRLVNNLVAHLDLKIMVFLSEYR